MNINELMVLVRRALKDPQGLGVPYLASNIESRPAYTRFLHHVVAAYKPQLVVECGVYMATCTAHMAMACRNTLVIGIDRNFHPSAYDIVKHFPNIILLPGDTVSMSEQVWALSKNRQIGLLYLDSTHDSDTPMCEYQAYEQMFAPECLVACDDILDPQMGRFWNWLPGEKYELHDLHQPVYNDQPVPGFGISIVRK